MYPHTIAWIHRKNFSGVIKNSPTATSLSIWEVRAKDWSLIEERIDVQTHTCEWKHAMRFQHRNMIMQRHCILKNQLPCLYPHLTAGSVMDVRRKTLWNVRLTLRESEHYLFYIHASSICLQEQQHQKPRGRRGWYCVSRNTRFMPRESSIFRNKRNNCVIRQLLEWVGIVNDRPYTFSLVLNDSWSYGYWEKPTSAHRPNASRNSLKFNASFPGCGPTSVTWKIFDRYVYNCKRNIHTWVMSAVASNDGMIRKSFANDTNSCNVIRSLCLTI